MSTVAFLASVVDPRVASAAAKAALGKEIQTGMVFPTLIPSRSIHPILANFSGVEFLRTISKFTKGKRGSLSNVHVLDKT